MARLTLIAVAALLVVPSLAACVEVETTTDDAAADLERADIRLDVVSAAHNTATVIVVYVHNDGPRDIRISANEFTLRDVNGSVALVEASAWFDETVFLRADPTSTDTATIPAGAVRVAVLDFEGVDTDAAPFTLTWSDGTRVARADITAIFIHPDARDEPAPDPTPETPPHFNLLNVVGYYDSAAAGIDTLNVTIQLAAGSPSVDLSTLTVRYNDGTQVAEYAYDAVNDDPTSDSDWPSIQTGKLGLYWIRNIDGDTVTAPHPMMEDGDIVRVYFALEEPLRERTDVELTLTPEGGRTLEAGFTTPSGLSGKTYHTLR